MNRWMSNEKLINKIQEYGFAARDHRQVYKRLSELLPQRLKTMSNDQMRSDDDGTKADSLRSALVSEDYLSSIDEVINVFHQGLEARVQYETHMLLFEARRSLRAFNARK
jgi:uncharacterized membrane protein YheB (UPF0754 family)